MSQDASLALAREPPARSGWWRSAIWPTIALVLAVFAGPLLHVLAMSEGFEAQPTPYFSGPTFMFFAALTSYAVLVRPPTNMNAIIRHIVGFVASFLLVFYSNAYLGYMFFGFFDRAPSLSMYALGMGLWALAVFLGGLVHHVVLRSGVRFVPEVGAHLFAGVWPIFVTYFLGINELFLTNSLFGAWPLLLAPVPYAIIAVRRARRRGPRPAWRLVGLVLAAALPVYAIKAYFDASGDLDMPLLWPVRVVQDFAPYLDRRESTIDLAHIERGEVVRIGDYHYRFDTMNGANAHPIDSARPDRLVFVQLYVPTEALGLEPRPGLGLTLNMSTHEQSSNSGIVLQYEDLTLWMVRGRDWPSDEEMANRMRAFMDAAKVD